MSYYPLQDPEKDVENIIICIALVVIIFFLTTH